MGDAVGDGGWEVAPSARKAETALGFGIGSGTANDKPGACAGVSKPGTALSTAIALRRTFANSSISGAWGEYDGHEDQELLRAGGSQLE